ILVYINLKVLIMKRFLAVATLLSLAISGSALAANNTVKSGQATPTVKEQKSNKVHAAGKTKSHNTVEKKTPTTSDKG
ncbi:hypothetical protein, partial [Providencia stuartii]